MINSGFFATLPDLQTVEQEDADIAWLVYDLQEDESSGTYRLRLSKTVYTKFENALDQITRSNPGDETIFLNRLQSKLDEKLENTTPPDNQTIDEEF